MILRATLDDPDGSVSNEVWTWERSADGSTGWTAIPGETDSAYWVVAADVGKFLRASVTYTDAHGAGQTAKGAIDAAVLRALTAVETFGPPVLRFEAPDSLVVRLVGAESDDITGYDLRYCDMSDDCTVEANWTVVALTGTGRTTTISGIATGAYFEVQGRAGTSDGKGPWSESREFKNYPPIIALRDGVTELTVAENFVGEVTGSPLSVIEYDGDPVQLKLKGDDADWFEFYEDYKLFLVKPLDFEKDSFPLKIVIEGYDGHGGSTRHTTGSGSFQITITDVAEPPEAPNAPTVSVPSDALTSLLVEWEYPVNPGPTITGYEVQYCDQAADCSPAADWTDVGFDAGTFTSTTIESLTAGVTYEVQVQATNPEGSSPWSQSGVAVLPTPTTGMTDMFEFLPPSVTLPADTSSVLSIAGINASDGKDLTLTLSVPDNVPNPADDPHAPDRNDTVNMGYWNRAASELTFTKQNWTTPQEVTLNAEKAGTVELTITAEGLDPHIITVIVEPFGIINDPSEFDRCSRLGYNHALHMWLLEETIDRRNRGWVDAWSVATKHEGAAGRQLDEAYENLHDAIEARIEVEWRLLNGIWNGFLLEDPPRLLQAREAHEAYKAAKVALTAARAAWDAYVAAPRAAWDAALTAAVDAYIVTNPTATRTEAEAAVRDTAWDTFAVDNPDDAGIILADDALVVDLADAAALAAAENTARSEKEIARYADFSGIDAATATTRSNAAFATRTAVREAGTLEAWQQFLLDLAPGCND